MKNTLIAKIKNQIDEEKYETYTNEWNVANQLIDIIAVSSESMIEIINQDLTKSKMQVKDVVDAVISERLVNPFKVMEKICKFYGIDCLKELPIEQWRGNDNNTTVIDTTKPIDTVNKSSNQSKKPTLFELIK